MAFVLENTKQSPSGLLRTLDIVQVAASVFLRVRSQSHFPLMVKNLSPSLALAKSLITRPLIPIQTRQKRHQRNSVFFNEILRSKVLISKMKNLNDNWHFIWHLQSKKCTFFLRPIHLVFLKPKAEAREGPNMTAITLLYSVMHGPLIWRLSYLFVTSVKWNW